MLSVLFLSWINACKIISVLSSVITILCNSIADRLYFNGLIRNKVIFFPYITLLAYFGIGKFIMSIFGFY